MSPVNIFLHAHPQGGHEDPPPKPPGAPDRTPVKEPDKKIPEGDPQSPDKKRSRL